MNIDELTDRENENAELRNWQTSVNQLLNQMLDLVTKLSAEKMDRQGYENEIREF